MADQESANEDAVPRHDKIYWQRLRGDRRSAAAAGLAIVAVISSTLSLLSVIIPDVPTQARANPLYWLVIVPVAWWSAGSAKYEPRAVRLWIPAISLASGISTAVAIMVHRGSGLTAQEVVCAVTLSTSAMSILAYRGSMVFREGPAR